MKLLAVVFFVISCSHHKSPEQPPFELDCHVHSNNNSQDDLTFDPHRAKLAYSSAGFRGACILSPTYSTENNPKCWNGKKCAPDKNWVNSTNLWIANQPKNLADRSISFCGIDPRYPWWKEAITYCSEIGMKGIKLHTYVTKFPLMDPKNYSILKEISEFAGKLNLPVLIHSHFQKKDEVEKLLLLVKETPKTIFILGHMLGRDISMLNESIPNAYIETSASIFWHLKKTIEVVQIWKKFGIDRILFGSDWPVFHPAETLWALRQYPLSEEEFKKIVTLNSKKLFFPEEH